MSAEPKLKLNLGSGFSITPKAATTPTAGLKLNHGKPNYTINRSPSTCSSPTVTTPVSGSPFGIVLRKTTSPAISPEQPSSPTSVKPPLATRTFSTPTRNTPITPSAPKVSNYNGTTVTLRSTAQLTNGNSQNSNEEPEFLRAHRKMAAKISSQDYEEINRNRMSYTEIMNVSTPKPPPSPLPQVEAEKEETDGDWNSVEVEEAVQEAIEEVTKESTEEVQEEPIEEPKPSSFVEQMNALIAATPLLDVSNGHAEEEETKETSNFVDQLNTLIAKGPTEVLSSPDSPPMNGNNHVDENGNHNDLVELKKNVQAELAATFDQAENEAEKLSVDENGNTLPADLAKLKFDIQEINQNDVTVTTTIVH